MPKIKISQLPAKAANLAATDLLEVSEVSGLTYVSKKITGAELVGNRVPYTGATSDVDLGEYELKAGQIELDQSPTGTAGVAVTRWNDSIGLTETTLKGGSVILKNGVDLVARVVNKVTPNTTLTKAAYPVVKISGAQGQRLAVDYAQANNDNNSADTLGIVTETIATNQEGFILTVGQLEGINTTGSLQGESWADGNVLYLSPTIPGGITNIKPNGSTGHIVVIGYVEHSHAINGKIYVKIMNGWELDELHNVYINPATLANNDALIYESSTQLWKNKPVTETIISLSDITTNDVSTTKHGFAPKLPNDASKFLDGTGNYTSPPTGLTVGTTAVTSGTNGRVFFQAGGVVQQDEAFLWDTTNKRMQLLGTGVIAAPAANSVLEIKAKNGLSDIAFRVRNSVDTKNLVNITGLGDVYLGDGVTVTNQGTEPLIAIGKGTTVNGVFNSNPIAIGNTTTSIGNSVAIGKGSSAGTGGTDLNIAIGYNAISTGSGSPGMAIGTNVNSTSAAAPGSIVIGHSMTTTSQALANIVVGRYINSVQGFIPDAFAFGSGVSNASRASLDIGNSFSVYINQNTRALFLNQKSNLVFRNGQSLTSGTHFDANATNTFTIHNGTAPVTNISDAFQQYSADIVAGNAAPHFRTENGDIIKLYKNAAVTTPQGIADALTNLGVLTASTIAPSIQSVVSAATVTPVNGNDLVKITAQAAALTLANPTGVWPEGKDLMIRIKDDGLGARAITWDTNYRAIGVTLPTTTVLGKTTYVGVIYNSDDAKWDVIGVTTQA